MVRFDIIILSMLEMTSFNQISKNTSGKRNKYRNSTIKKTVGKNSTNWDKGINQYFVSKKSCSIKQNEQFKKDYNWSNEKMNGLKTDCLSITSDVNILQASPSVGYLNMSPHGSRKTFTPIPNTENSEAVISIKSLPNKNKISLTPLKIHKQ